MHFGVDSAVAFLALFVVIVVFFGVPLSVVVGLAMAAGLVAAPFTRRAEARALAARAASAGSAPEGR